MREVGASLGTCGRDVDGADEEGTSMKADFVVCPLTDLEAGETNPPAATAEPPMSPSRTENPELSPEHDGRERRGEMRTN